MDSQNQGIKGARELSTEEIDAINKIRVRSESSKDFAAEIKAGVVVRGETGEETLVQPDAKWMSIAMAHMLEAFVALEQAVINGKSG